VAALASGVVGIQFTAPASGTVLVYFSAFIRAQPGGAGAQVYVNMGFVTRGTSTPVGPWARVLDLEPVTTGGQWVSVTTSPMLLVTGLAPGTVYTWDLAGMVGGNGTAVVYADNGLGVGAINMAVFAA
jgi:hypothetical protein